MKSRQQWTLIALAFAAAGSWWLTASDDGEAPPAAPEAPGQPGYYLRDAKLEQTDDDGRVYLRITTERAAQDPASQEIELTPVRVEYMPPGSAPWLLTADQGRLPPGGRIVSLSENVTLTGTPVPRAAPAIIRTPRLALDTVDSIATTTAAVRIELGKQVMLATGMRADLKHDRMALEANVRGRYVR